MRGAGHTLIELVIVIVIIGVLAAFVAPILTETVSSYDTTARNVELLGQMRYAMDRMSREMRQMRRELTNPANYDISTMTSTKLVFVATDGNQVTIDNTTLSSEVALGYTAPAASATLTDSVKAAGFTFTYCRVDGTTCATSTGATVDKSNVAFVQVDMTLTGSGTGDYVSTMRVDLKNP